MKQFEMKDVGGFLYFILFFLPSVSSHSLTVECSTSNERMDFLARSYHEEIWLKNACFNSFAVKLYAARGALFNNPAPFSTDWLGINYSFPIDFCSAQPDLNCSGQVYPDTTQPPLPFHGSVFESCCNLPPFCASAYPYNQCFCYL